MTTHRIEPTVATIEPEFASVLAQCGAGDRIESVGMPVPGLPQLAVTPGATGSVTYTHPAPVGAQRGTFDESRLLVVAHPRYDGFVVATFTAHADMIDLDVVVHGEAVAPDLIEPHWRRGPIARGQARPIDLSLQLQHLHGGSGTVTVLARNGADGTPLAPPLEIVVATSHRTDCAVAGAVDGPLDPETLGATIEAITTAGRWSRRRAVRQALRAIQDAEAARWSTA